MHWFGIETEYGIAVESADASDLIEASRAVVNSYQGVFAAPWNYAVENPRHDVRGFDAKALAHDPQDAQFDKPSSKTISDREDRVDHMLPNGARLYNDHGHPEFATPECDDLFDLIAHDKAGEQIVWQCAQHWSREVGKKVQIIKNNVDFHGASYGCHESYLMARDVDWESALSTIAAFLATRIVFAGAGKVGDGKSTFQLSQRADFMETLQSVDTLYRRPLVNTRDEPHADAAKYRRLHVISGDANMSEYATALKAGSTRLLVRLLESGWRLPFALRDPVLAMKHISRDESYQWIIETDDHKKISALEVQETFVDAICETGDIEESWIVNEWRRILQDLRNDPLGCHDRLDWVAKKVLLGDFVESEGLDWKHDVGLLQSLDIAYADLDPEQGLYHGLVEAGQMRTLISQQQQSDAMQSPPANTRAAMRGLLVQEFHQDIKGISWESLQWETKDAMQNMRLPGEYDSKIMAHLEVAKSLDEVALILRS
ncbi:MAG: proteasome accessory factor PafA2 family protein [Abditibacteriaceae bacterium]